MMFWTGFATALFLLAGIQLFRFFRHEYVMRNPEYAARHEAYELYLCGMNLADRGLDQAALSVWLHIATTYPRNALKAEHYLDQALLSGRQTDEAFVRAYRSLAEACPTR